MRDLRRILVWVAAVGLLVPRVSSAQPDLWQKAVQIAARNQNWVPGEAYTRTEVMNTKGKLEHVEESEFRILRRQGGEVKTEIVRVVRDGKDETAQARKKQQEAEKKNPDKAGGKTFRVGRSPFLPEVQDSVTVQPLDSTATIDGKRCAGFRFEELVPRGRKIVGTAWLDVQTGAPVLLEFEPRPLPKRVKKMRTQIRYRWTPEGDWYPVEMTMSGEGGFLFIKKRFRSVIRLSKHWRAEEERKGDSN